MKSIISLFILMAFTWGALQAQRTVTGTVTDGEAPLIGATVVVNGTSVGTVTDIDGTFSIQVPAGATELIFSYIGLESQSINVEGQSVVNVYMMEGYYIDEVVITGYGSKKRSELVGSSVQVRADELEQVPVASVDQILQGKVAGLTISATSGTPGSAQSIRIRGISSVSAGNEPLYVIDGVPIDNNTFDNTTTSFTTLAALNVNDIESVTVLKDASATSLYGARGSNGVIVITTKRGKSGKTTINLSSSYGVSNDAIEGPVMLTAAEREMLYYEALYNTYGESQGFDLAGAKAFYEANPNAFGTAYTDWNAAGRPEGNWADVITNKNAPFKEVNLSASGGDEKQNFYASLGYYDMEATVIASYLKRYSGSLKYSRSLSNNLRFDTKNTVSSTIQDGTLEGAPYYEGARGVKFFCSPLATPYNADGTVNIEDFYKYSAGFHNPIWIAEHNIGLSKLERYISNNSIAWNTPIRDLTFTTRLSIDHTVFDSKYHSNRTHADMAFVGGATNASFNKILNYVIQNSFDYAITVKNNHHFNFKVLQEFLKGKSYYISAYGEGFSTDGLTNLASASNPKGASSGASDRSQASYLGVLDYDFDNKYILSASYRREGNSKFHPDYRWGDFWSVGVAWNLDKEDFFANIGFVDNLKLRASYGRTGNDGIGLNQYQVLLSYSGAYGGAGTVSTGNIGNESISWEIADNFEAGADFGLLQNRVNGTFSYFRRETKKSLHYVPLPPTTGVGGQFQNIGRMKNLGLEVELNVDVIRSKDLNLTVGGNVATVHNKGFELPVNGSYTGNGHPVGEWQMVKFAGVDPQTGENLYYLNGEGTETTTNFNEAEGVSFGKNALPTLTSGVYLHVDFKGFFLDANAYYAGGHMVYEFWTRYTSGTDRHSIDLFNGINSLLDRWQKPGDITNVPKMTYTFEPWRDHSKFLREGDFLRVKNITFGYTLPPSLTKKIRIEDSKIFVRGINLFTWVKDDQMQYDPETASGVQNLSTPPVKSFIVGLNLKF